MWMLKAGRTRQTQGFTLMEMIVVLVLLAFSATLVFGLNLRQRDKFVLRDFGVSLGSYLQLVRSTALTQVRTGTCVLDLESGQVFSPLSTRTLSVPQGLGIARPQASFEPDAQDQLVLMEFFMDGSAAGGNIALEYKGYLGLIQVDPLLGEVRYYFDQPEILEQEE